uniref:Uncharacterized protein n=1 Tax=Arion vulgaris TaxID=1028688 RepID=A0A0B6XYY0_9EUPU
MEWEKSAGALARTALRCTINERRSGLPKETWRRIVARQLKDFGLTWETINKKATEW